MIHLMLRELIVTACEYCTSYPRHLHCIQQKCSGISLDYFKLCDLQSTFKSVEGIKVQFKVNKDKITTPWCKQSAKGTKKSMRVKTFSTLLLHTEINCKSLGKSFTTHIFG